MSKAPALSTGDILSAIQTVRGQRVILATDLLHDTALRDVYQRLQPLLQPLPDQPRPKIGFRETSPQYGKRRTSLQVR